MVDRAKDVDAEVKALLDITNNNYAKAIFIVCESIQRANKSKHQTR